MDAIQEAESKAQAAAVAVSTCAHVEGSGPRLWCFEATLPDRDFDQHDLGFVSVSRGHFDLPSHLCSPSAVIDNRRSCRPLHL